MLLKASTRYIWPITLMDRVNQLQAIKRGGGFPIGAVCTSMAIPSHISLCLCEYGPSNRREQSHVQHTYNFAFPLRLDKILFSYAVLLVPVSVNYPVLSS
jgi:hypothetical protein